MTLKDRINDEYFEYLCKLIDIDRFSKQVTYKKLLAHLHNIEFTWFIPHDDNRADDGIQLRRRYGLDQNDISLSQYLTGPCSVLEMMVALAIYAEEHIMSDPQVGNRTGQWFWSMIVNLGLGDQMDDRFDRRHVDGVLQRFLDRRYEPTGQGGLFMIRNCDRDLRKVEIFHQLCWYLGTIT
jgi:hypothetical protein